MKLGPAGEELIKKYEGFSLVGYLPTPGDVPTIGWGHTGPEVTIGLVISAAQAEEWFQKDTLWASQCVSSSLTQALNSHQFDSLCSLCFNIGCLGFKDSALVRFLNMERIYSKGYSDPRNRSAITVAWKAWNLQKGKVLAGLVNRRQAELDLFYSDPEIHSVS